MMSSDTTRQATPTDTDVVTIDGREGEGGGQMLRSALALSARTGRPFVMKHIRAGRKKPGLMRQHLTCVRAAATLCDAVVDGDELRSTSLRFTPGAIRSGRFHFAIGTAGATTLVAQTIIPIAAGAPGAVEAVIEGGTHVSFAPTSDYLRDVFVPATSTLWGRRLSFRREQVGFNPSGGGRVVLQVGEPLTASVTPLDRRRRGPLRRCVIGGVATALVSGAVGMTAHLLRGGLQGKLRVPVDVDVEEAAGTPGAGCLQVTLEWDDGDGVATEQWSRVLEREPKPKTLAAALVAEVLQFVDADVAVGEHLADQLLLPLALGAGGVFSTTSPTLHTTTNADIIRRFCPQVTVTPAEGVDGRTEVVARVG